MERVEEAPEARERLAAIPLPNTSADAAGQPLEDGEVVQLLQHVAPGPRFLRTRDSAGCSLTEVSVKSMDEREADLIRRVLLGDAEAYEGVVAPHLETARRLARSQLRGSGDVDDCVQKAAIRAWERLANLKPDKPFRPWFLKIVVRQCQDVRRSSWVMRRVYGGFWDLTDEDDWLERCAEGARLRGAFARLPRDQQVATYLHFVEDLPLREVAETLGIRVVGEEIPCQRRSDAIVRSIWWLRHPRRDVDCGKVGRRRPPARPGAARGRRCGDPVRAAGSRHRQPPLRDQKHLLQPAPAGLLRHPRQPAGAPHDVMAPDCFNTGVNHGRSSGRSR